MHTRRVTYLSVAAVLTVGCVIGAAQYGWWRFMGIAAHQMMATATVLSMDCKNNNDVSYSFLVQGTAVQGRDNWIDCRKLKPGDTLQISFSSRDPAQNMAGDAYGRLLSETISILLASILGSIVVAVVFVSGKKQKT